MQWLNQMEDKGKSVSDSMLSGGTLIFAEKSANNAGKVAFQINFIFISC